MSGTCPGCPLRTPVVSLAHAQAVVRRMAPASRLTVVDACVHWLTQPHEGLTVKSGIVGRDYGAIERALIASEEWAVETLACPFAAERGCLLDGCYTPGEWLRDQVTKPPWGWLPALILKLLDPPTLRELHRTRWVADAKVVGVSFRRDFPKPRWSTNQPYVSVSTPADKEEVVRDGSAVPRPL